MIYPVGGCSQNVHSYNLGPRPFVSRSFGGKNLFFPHSLTRYKKLSLKNPVYFGSTSGKAAGMLNKGMPEVIWLKDIKAKITEGAVGRIEEYIQKMINRDAGFREADKIEITALENGLPKITAIRGKSREIIVFDDKEANNIKNKISKKYHEYTHAEKKEDITVFVDGEHKRDMLVSGKANITSNGEVMGKMQEFHLDDIGDLPYGVKSQIYYDKMNNIAGAKILSPEGRAITVVNVHSSDNKHLFTIVEKNNKKYIKSPGKPIEAFDESKLEELYGKEAVSYLDYVRLLMKSSKNIFAWE